MHYDSFIQGKIKRIEKSGFQIDESDLNSNLFDFQKFIVKRALESGRYAIFADCGLGKTLMQLEWANQVTMYTRKPVLILCPLAVSAQTIREGQKFGIDVAKAEMIMSVPGIYITNYEQLDNINTSAFSGVVLDESSILKNFEGETKKLIIEKFKHTPYKLACTATPSPNDPMEIGNHSEFLNVMTRNEMLAMYFIHDGGETAKWRLKGHAIKDFYRFISTWAIMLNNPSDIGFPMCGYDLPELNLINYVIETEKRDNGMLFNDVAISATNFNQELRLTKEQRIKKVLEIIESNPDENFIIWVKQNEESEQLSKLIPGSVEVKGNDKPEFKEKALLGFANNEFKYLITKTKIAQFGLNYQNCANQIFMSLDFSFEGLYQAIRRSYRFGQKRNVNIHLITTDTMSNVIDSIKTKERSFKTMQEEMSKSINEFLNDEKTFFNCSTQEIISDDYRIACGDSFRLIKFLDAESIDSSIFSPPFSSLYTYSDKAEDLSNCLNHDTFYSHFKFMIPELFRILKSGRLVGLHLTQLTTGIARDGFYSVIDFRGEIIRLFQECGFYFHGEVTIWKNPELAAIRTKNHQLLHKSTKRDSTICRPGLADYLVIFRKPGINNHPVNHDGSGIPFEKWCEIASPVWMDIEESDTLQFRTARENEDERHITPTQLSVIERFLILYSNPGDTIFTPFMGIGSEVYQALKMNRKGIGFELKESYFELARKNIEAVLEEKNQLSLF